MGDIADMVLDGTLCESCGEALPFISIGHDYPRYCSSCNGNRKHKKPKNKKKGEDE